jgi:lipid A oxidase
MAKSYLRGLGLSFVILFSTTFSARAEWLIEGFTGFSAGESSDLQLEQPGGTSLIFHNIPWEMHDFDEPMYYGYRVLYFPGRDSNWGFGLEFIHAKVYLDTSDSVRVTGTRAGTPVNGTESLGDTFEGFNISNGINYLTADVLYRFFLDKQHPESFLSRFQPYVGIGLGITVPHPEPQLKGEPLRAKYQFGGFAAQAMAGVSFDITKYLLLYTEYKLSYAKFDDLSFTGGTIQMDLLEHHWVFGVGVKF